MNYLAQISIASRVKSAGTASADADATAYWALGVLRLLRVLRDPGNSPLPSATSGAPLPSHAPLLTPCAAPVLTSSAAPLRDSPLATLLLAPLATLLLPPLATRLLDPLAAHLSLSGGPRVELVEVAPLLALPGFLFLGGLFGCKVEGYLTEI